MKKRVAMRFFIVSFFLAIAFPAVSGAGDAGINITPAAAKSKTAIIIEGTGFKPGENVDLTLDLGEGILIGLGTQKVEVLTADPAGAFSAQTAVPAVAEPGTYALTAEGDQGTEARTELVVQ